jgi:phospholipase D1/2
MAEQKINQILKEDGTCAKKASSSIDWFLRNNDTGWCNIPGNVGKPAAPFSDSFASNTVGFFTTGKDYFEHVATSISEAEKSIFIAGWQVNYDVELTPGKTLFIYLKDAIRKKPALKLYVMPWLSPKLGVDTGDFETMLAIFQLNAGLPEQRAFCLPAMQQSDMKGGLTIAFSHHQKLVVIDNEKAYVGGIDIAYGRRDDGRFMLSADGRTGNELYNSCVPAGHSMNFEECAPYLTRLELLAACSDAWTGVASAWLASTAKGDLARGLDKVGETAHEMSEYWNNLDLTPEFVDKFYEKYIKPATDAAKEGLNRVQDDVMDTQQSAYRWAWKTLQPDAREQLKRLRETKGGNSDNPGAALMSWINNGGLESVPAKQTKRVVEMIESLTYKVIARQSPLAATRQKPYAPLEQGGRIVPKGGTIIDTKTQPRMPWHDVHSVIGGPSVYDLSMNFVRRWNSVALRYDQMKPSDADKDVKGLLEAFGLLDKQGLEQVERLEQYLKQKIEQLKQLERQLQQQLAQVLDQVQKLEYVKRLSLVREQIQRLEQNLRSAQNNKPEQDFKAPRIAEDCMPERVEKGGGTCRVQVLRSAPKNLLKDEAAAGYGEPPTGEQNNCLYAMLRAIAGASNFIYIENQFFQSSFGHEGNARGHLSGPMAAMLDITASPGYDKFADTLEIRNVPLANIPLEMRWAKVDDVQRDPEGPAFLADLYAAISNNTAVEISQTLGDTQTAMQNQIAQALITRIELAIANGLPFHVYMVLPVHPEGTLNILNIMSQVHLTMQSLVFGNQSLVNGVRRAILAKRRLKAKGAQCKGDAVEWEKTKAEVARMPLGEVITEVGDEWKEYLTLLNLRNWEMIGGKPVTEQIYVHSKLLIADDRVAILGSANINDRSQLGGRDSELAVIVTDEAPKSVSITGKQKVAVSTCVHDLRVRLWSKLFGLSGGNKPAEALRAVLEKPAAPETWKQIQAVSKENARLYATSFAFTPCNAPDPSVQQKDPNIIDPVTRAPLGLGASLWPTWHYNNYGNHNLGGKMAYRMPFEPAFWQPPESGEAQPAHTYYARTNAPVSAPQGVQGYIVELPTQWTLGENNNSGMNMKLIAQLMRLNPESMRAYAEADHFGQRRVST